jgi:hypothetical protein
MKKEAFQCVGVAWGRARLPHPKLSDLESLMTYATNRQNRFLYNNYRENWVADT